MILNYEDNGKKRSLQIENADIQLLLYVYYQKRMTQIQMHEFYHLFKEITQKAFQKKMSKFKKGGLISRIKREFVKSKGAYLYVVHIGRKGVSLLRELNLLPYTLVSKPKSYKDGNIDHDTITQQVNLNVITQYPGHIKLGYNDNHYLKIVGPVVEAPPTAALAQNNRLAIWQQIKLSPAVDSDFRNVLEIVVDPKIFFNEEERSLYPDSVMRSGKNIICIEADNRTEQLAYKTFHGTSLSEKFEKYVKLAEEHPELNFIIFFVVADNSITLLNYKSDCSGRIANIKERLHEVNGTMTANLEIYLTSLENSKRVIKQVLDIMCHVVVPDPRIQSKGLLKTGEYEVIDLKQVFDLGRYGFAISSLNYMPDEMLYVKKVNKSNDSYIVFFFRMVEGNFRTQEKLAYFARLLEVRQLPSKSIFRVWYDTSDAKTAIEKDVLRFDLKEMLQKEHVLNKVLVGGLGCRFEKYNI